MTDSSTTDSTTAGTTGTAADERDAAARLSTAPVDAEHPAEGGDGGTGGPGQSVPGSFGGTRRPGAAGAAAWYARETAGWLRWFWRQLTSMRVALLLLFLLSLAAVPGSVIPQKDVDSFAVEEFRQRHETLGPLYERLQLFDVYSSVWFSAVYILLFVSLIGCIVPRTWQFAGQLRGRPPRAPRRLTRMPAHTTWRTAAAPDEVLAAARSLLSGRRFRTDLSPASGASASGGSVAAPMSGGSVAAPSSGGSVAAPSSGGSVAAPSSGGSVAAEKGYLREAGNLVFHISLIVMLLAFAAGQLWNSEGGKLIVEGDGFSNTLTQYDDFTSGSLYDTADLDAFGFRLDEFHATFERTGPQRGTARTFRADVTYWEGADGAERQTSIEVNHPLKVGGSKVFLIGHGYAPVVTVTDGQGDVAFRGPVPFLPQESLGLTSTGVVKVTDYRNADGEREQLGFQGIFTPTYGIDAERGPHSTFPELDYPVLSMNAFHGDLGIDSGIPQNIYQLDTDKMEQFKAEDGDLFRIDLRPGESVELPDGAGTLKFESVEQWASFQVSQEPGEGWALAGASAAVLGLAGSLFIQRRRVWVRAERGADGSTVVEMAALGRSESARVPEELGELAAALHGAAPSAPAPGRAGPEETAPEETAGETAPEETAAAEPADTSDAAEGGAGPSSRGETE
ncbi:cytochrome C biogenesis protein [Streptomyces carminius]|uniref:Cytochrome C biogenesis protein n=1 Tax=Streptomyces carminius TaxID=2665496 RepID=A0A2M8LUE8_9ACTN|nr:cytochrome c biogenesis protein ResB [Streptomyces carminius]PJE95570.1 cytochrome C biogenesis protein [Streptomyces carminius]